MQDLSKQPEGFVETSEDAARPGLGRLAIFFFLFLITILAAWAQPPFDPEQSSFSTELEIVFPQTQNFKLNAVVNLSFHVFNSSGILMDNESISCHGHIFGLQNQHITAQNLSWDGNADFEFIALPTDTLGLFSYFVWCKPTGLTSVTEGGFVSVAYEISAEGKVDSYLRHILLFGLVVLMVALAFVLKDHSIMIMAGFALMGFGVYLGLSGLIGFNDLLVQIVAVVIIGIGMYLTGRASLEIFQGDF